MLWSYSTKEVYSGCPNLFSQVLYAQCFLIGGPWTTAGPQLNLCQFANTS